MWEDSKTCLHFCIFQGSVQDVRAAQTTIGTFFLLLLLMELYPLVPLFTGSELASKLMEHRFVIWFLAFLWHVVAILLIFALLRLKHLENRLRGTLASYFGVFILIQFMGLLLRLLSTTSLPAGIQTLLLFCWLFWSCCVFGYVFRSALDVKYYQGVLVALLVNLLSYVLAFIVIALFFSQQLQAVIQQ